MRICAPGAEKGKSAETWPATPDEIDDVLALGTDGLGTQRQHVIGPR
jgi:hypothetical protein